MAAKKKDVIVNEDVIEDVMEDVMEDDNKEVYLTDVEILKIIVEKTILGNNPFKEKIVKLLKEAVEKIDS